MGYNVHNKKEFAENLETELAPQLEAALKVEGIGAVKSVAVDFTFPTSATAVDGVDPVTGEVVTLPKCVLTKAYYNVGTTYASTAGGTDKAVLQLGTSASAAGIMTAIAIETGTPWDAGAHGTLIGSFSVGSNATTLDAGTDATLALKFATGYLATAAGSTLQIKSDVACTAGAMRLVVEYFEVD